MVFLWPCSLATLNDQRVGSKKFPEQEGSTSVKWSRTISPQEHIQQRTIRENKYAEHYKLGRPASYMLHRRARITTRELHQDRRILINMPYANWHFRLPWECFSCPPAIKKTGRTELVFHTTAMWSGPPSTCLNVIIYVTVPCNTIHTKYMYRRMRIILIGRIMYIIIHHYTSLYIIIHHCTSLYITICTSLHTSVESAYEHSHKRFMPTRLPDSAQKLGLRTR